ncbi:sodium-coupled monocarboxylate transporter 1-like [Anopheles ziemanni]|uniref:sodium-coupled monocarboxylate transporter 1-like n=1 Tax=Anopheles coustani TaxID=139045 RepID=UPI0026595AF0|nr:sodium-coupled monocarboxylate transporter 1-like [Anopheles coustani]XP_058171577.1 sodium-coupled monocarboxylate transporter 1-like [Anopheles ziemanni]
MAGLNVDDVKVSLQKFGLYDYVVFVLMLLSCVMIGIYFGFMKKKAKKGEAEADYLVGNRQMKIIPVSLSLIASFISGITLLGTPTEIYLYGVQYMYIVGGVITMGFIMMYFYLPVFHNLKLTSTYQYLQTRFDKRMRLFGSILFTLATMAWLPIVIYVPALAFNQVTGINVHLITPIVCVICIFYTCVGGLKAVVWTDVIQTVLMFGAMLLIIVKGTYDVGGLSVVMERATASGRIEGPDLRFDITTRHNIYSCVIGGVVYWLKSNAVSQNMIQRYLSLPSLAAAKKALWTFIFGTLVLLFLCCYSGLLIYAKYYDCDPLTTKLAKAKDQLLPLLVMDTLGDFPGLPGLFVAGVFSAALSSLSTGLNSMSAVVLEDFFKPFSNRPLTEKQTSIIMRAVVAVFGAICVVLVLVVEKLGSVLQLSMSLGSVSNGPLLGIFTLGVLIPWANGTGAIVGGAVGLAVMIWICLKAQLAIASGEMAFELKPVDTQGCSYHFIASEPMSMLAINTTAPSIDSTPIEPEFAIYHISYLWYTMIGALVTIIVAVIVSFIVGANNPDDMNPNLFSPFIQRILTRRRIAARTDLQLMTGGIKEFSQ